ncbi:hypothetical protein [Ornithinimicrobium cavernae]|uniref:hypothetical protein n=1 Tax=Ornithinimicrobium cavernae TaxID=2666047 RepID=UPI000D6951D7|nr:hypothetical protein [Ornithinimicrobium cavernae]
MPDHNPGGNNVPLSATELFDRAAELAPAMSVDPDAVITVGRRRVRRRRLSAFGAGSVALAMAGALWFGGPLDPFSDPDALQPAGITWQDGVEVDLFDNQPHSSELGRQHWSGELRSGEGDAQPELVLTRDGEQLGPIAAQDGPGDVMVFHADGLAVAAWQSPTGSLGEWPLWTPGMEAGQASSVDVEGSELHYAVAEFVPGAEPGLEELYWFSEDAGYAASGAPVESTVLTAGESTSIVMIDEAKQVWATGAPMPGAAPGLRVHAERMVAGAGLTGWTGHVAAAAAVGVLPPGASLSRDEGESATFVEDGLGSHTVVLASSPATRATAPVIRFTVDGSVHTLTDYLERDVKTVTVAGAGVQVDSTPNGLQLFVAPGRLALVPSQELDGDSAVLGSVGDGHLLVVPDWEPDGDVEDLRVLRVQRGSDAEQWAPVDSALTTTLFDGTPLIVLGLDGGTLEEGESVVGVGVADGDEVVPYQLKTGVRTGDIDL